MKENQHPGNKKAKPFLKWAGGKARLLSQLQMFYPSALASGEITRYIEPFIGGGAVFFDVAQRFDIATCYLFDINAELILVYRVIQRSPHKLIAELHKLATTYRALSDTAQKEFYYTVRDTFNANRRTMQDDTYTDAWIIRAAQLLFMNRTCFNGLFRLNSKGAFNVPHGRYKNPRILNADNILNVSGVLQYAEIRRGDFMDCEAWINEHTFVYFDPPYRPISKTSHFTSYSKYKFEDREQIALAHFFKTADKKYSAKLMLSNSDPKNENPDDDFFETLYADFHIHRVLANRRINANAHRRGQIKELLITNYKKIV